jgi:Cap4 dsDNA endonuclease
MKDVDNGGANAIKGFNYQKSVIVLIAVLNYLKSKDFQIYVEAEDDIVVSMDRKKTYIQVKSSSLSVKKIINRPKGKDSIIEKNLSCGDEQSYYKLITPSFSGTDKNLEKVQPAILREGALVYSYSQDGILSIGEKLTLLSDKKLENSRVALTAFKANQKDAFRYITGVMADEGISVDNNYGRASLQELVGQIDERSEIIIKDKSDIERKKFTSTNLSIIFSHSTKMEYFDKILDKLGYNLHKKMEIKKQRISIAALYGALHKDSLDFIEGLDLSELSEAKVLEASLETLNFDTAINDSTKIAIIVDAFSQIIFERSVA